MENILLNKIPKKYHERIERIEKEDGLIDGCKYMVYFADGWKYNGDFTSVPARNIKEIIYFAKGCEKE